MAIATGLPTRTQTTRQQTISRTLPTRQQTTQRSPLTPDIEPQIRQQYPGYTLQRDTNGNYVLTTTSEYTSRYDQSQNRKDTATFTPHELTIDKQGNIIKEIKRGTYTADAWKDGYIAEPYIIEENDGTNHKVYELRDVGSHNRKSPRLIYQQEGNRIRNIDTSEHARKQYSGEIQPDTSYVGQYHTTKPKTYTQKEIDAEFLRRTRDRDFGDDYNKKWKEYTKKLREYQHQTQYMKALGWDKPQYVKEDEARALGLIKNDIGKYRTTTNADISSEYSPNISALQKEVKKGGIRGAIAAIMLSPEITKKQYEESKKIFLQDVEEKGGNKEYWKNVLKVPWKIAKSGVIGTGKYGQYLIDKTGAGYLPGSDIELPWKDKEWSKKLQERMKVEGSIYEDPDVKTAGILIGGTITGYALPTLTSYGMWGLTLYQAGKTIKEPTAENVGQTGTYAAAQLYPYIAGKGGKIGYWLKRSYPFRADKIIIAEKASQIASTFKEPNGMVIKPKGGVKSDILEFIKNEEGILAGGRSIEAHGIELSRYRQEPEGIQKSDIDSIWGTIKRANKKAKEATNMLNKKYPGRFEFEPAGGKTINARIKDKLTGDHYDFVGERVPSTRIGEYNVLDIAKQVGKKGEALRNPERIYRSYDPEKRKVLKDYTDFVDIIRGTVYKNTDAKWFLKDSAKDYTTYNPSTRQLEVDTSKIPKQQKEILNKQGATQEKIPIEKYAEMIRKEEPSYDYNSQQKINEFYEATEKYAEELYQKEINKYYNQEPIRSYITTEYNNIYPYEVYPYEGISKPYTPYAPTAPKTDYTYEQQTTKPTAPYPTKTEYTYTVPAKEEPSKIIFARTKEKPTTRTKQKPERTNDKPSYQPVFQDNYGSIQEGDHYETYKDAEQAGMAITDITNFNKFTIKHSQTNPANIKKAQNYRKTYKFRKHKGIYTEKRYYRFDSRGERKRKFDIMPIINRQYAG